MRGVGRPKVYGRRVGRPWLGSMEGGLVGHGRGVGGPWLGLPTLLPETQPRPTNPPSMVRDYRPPFRRYGRPQPVMRCNVR